MTVRRDAPFNRVCSCLSLYPNPLPARLGRWRWPAQSTRLGLNPPWTAPLGPCRSSVTSSSTATSSVSEARPWRRCRTDRSSSSQDPSEGHHRARLAAILRLQRRGFCLASIPRLLRAWERGETLDQVLGLPPAPVGPTPGTESPWAEVFDSWSVAPGTSTALLPAPILTVIRGGQERSDRRSGVGGRRDGAPRRSANRELPGNPLSILSAAHRLQVSARPRRRR